MNLFDFIIGNVTHPDATVELLGLDNFSSLYRSLNKSVLELLFPTHQMQSLEVQPSTYIR